MKMAKSTVVIRQSLLQRQCRRHIAGSSSSRTSTSPQRRNAAATASATATCLKPFNEIPGPMALPMLRHSAHILPKIGNFHHTVGLDVLENLRKKYGDLVRLSKATRTRPVLYVFHPEMMREVYESGQTEPPHFDRSPLCHHRKGVGSLCPMHNDETKAVWSGLRLLLQEEAILKNYDAAFDDIATDVTRRLEELRCKGNVLNEELETEIYRWALETVGMMLFGIRLGCLDARRTKSGADLSPTEEPVEGLSPAERLVRCSRQISEGAFLVRSEETLKTESQTFNDALKSFDRHLSLTEHFLIKAIHTMTSCITRPEQVLLDKLRPLERRLLPLASDMLLAAVDPLAQTALTMFYQLSIHAAHQQRAHDEVLWCSASRAAGAAPPAAPARHSVPAASPAPPAPQYVSACARETLRLQPPTGGVVRRSVDSLVLDGFEIPAGVDIVLAHGLTSKEEKQWGRAKAFVPERWCDDGWQPLKASRAHHLASMPFGEKCPGTGISIKMLTSLAARITERYRIEWHGPAPALTLHGVNKIQRPYYFVLQNAS
ncbi:probable cytochrome P450 49a1-like isoform X1 [Bombyx mori]|uniref:Cytochrome P450 n=1 Tax=Bombyx mori TaxID=7091 RepID=A0A8R2QT24_BOMMO|nr:probable cytochrome P450 49a1-like isoform X3 [Bombyx mori]